MAYGGFGDGAVGGDDTLEAQRETEALQQVVAKTSKSVLPLLPSNPPRSASTRGGG